MDRILSLVGNVGEAFGKITGKVPQTTSVSEPKPVAAAVKVDDADEDFDVVDDYRATIHEVLKEKAPFLKIESVVENEHAKRGTPLHDRFMNAWISVEDSTVELLFHGTPEHNIENICRQGLDPGKRHGQAHGPGEYFAVDASMSVGYCRGGRKLLVVAVIMDRTGLTKDNGSIVVLHKPKHHLPLFVVTFNYY